MNTVHRLVDALRNDETFAEEVQTLANQPAALAELLTRHGFHPTPEEWDEALGQKDAEIADEALSSVAGGFDYGAVLRNLKERDARNRQQQASEAGADNEFRLLGATIRDALMSL